MNHPRAAAWCQAMGLTLGVLLSTQAVDAPPKPDDGLTEQQRAFWQKYQDSHAIEQAARRAEAEGIYLQARALFDKAWFQEALAQAKAALAKDPEHPAARELQNTIEGILSVRENRLQMATSWLAALQNVEVEHQVVQMSRFLAEGDQAMAAQDYVKAYNRYDRVSIGIRSFPLPFDWGDLRNQVEAKKLDAQAKARARDLEIRRQEALRSNAEAKMRESLADEARRLKVDEMMRRASESFKRGHHRHAAELAWQAYQMDRTRQDAHELYQKARAEAHEQFEEWLEAERPERLARLNEEFHLSLIPQNELLVFPADWFRRSLRQVQDLTVASAEEPWRVALNKQLDVEITFDWDEKPLEEVIDYLRRTAQLNIVPNPSITATPPAPIILKGTMKLRTVLNWICRQCTINMALRDEAIYLSKEEVHGDLKIRYYDVSELTSPIVDFPGPDLALAASSNNAQGGSVNPFAGNQPDAAATSTTTVTADELIELIKKTVAPGSWDNGDRVIKPRSSNGLFVRHSPEVHQEISRLLDNLRSRRGLLVKVQIRKLDLSKAFMEEIGVDWTDALTNLITAGTPNSYGYWRESGNRNLGLTNTNNLPANSNSNFHNNVIPGNAAYNGFVADYSYNIGGILNQPQLNVMLRAVEEESDSQTLHAPEVTCHSGQRSNFQYITQFSYIADYEISAVGTYDPQIRTFNTGYVIDVKPFVSADRKYITMEVQPASVNVSAINTEVLTTTRTLGLWVIVEDFPLELPCLEVQAARSTVRLPDKGTVCLGGMIEGNKERTHAGIPFLSHIPFLGRLFSSNGNYDVYRETQFLISTEIIDRVEREAQQ